jgi:hypothetical protein
MVREVGRGSRRTTGPTRQPEQRRAWGAHVPVSPNFICTCMLLHVLLEVVAVCHALLACTARPLFFFSFFVTRWCHAMPIGNGQPHELVAVRA